MRHFIIIFLSFLVFLSFTFFDEVKLSNYHSYVITSCRYLYANYQDLKAEVEEKEKEEQEKLQEELRQQGIIESSNLASGTGTITGYGPDCIGCSGITASGYDVRDTIYYEDYLYGQINIIAADRSLPFGTIVRFKNLATKSNDLIAIVLDRGGAIGFNKARQFDLLFASEALSYEFGIYYNVQFEILRYGF